MKRYLDRMITKFKEMENEYLTVHDDMTNAAHKLSLYISKILDEKIEYGQDLCIYLISDDANKINEQSIEGKILRDKELLPLYSKENKYKKYTDILKSFLLTCELKKLIEEVKDDFLIFDVYFILRYNSKDNTVSLKINNIRRYDGANIFNINDFSSSIDI